MKVESARLVPVAAIVLAVAACGKASGPEPAAPAGAAPASVAQPGPAPAAASTSSLTGTVLETMDSGGYTYMKLKTAEGEAWAAVNQTKIATGQSVTIASPMQMDGFESKTLKRKFDKIYFGTLAGEPGAAAPAAAPAMPGGMGAAPAGMPGAPAGMPQAMAAQHAQAAAGPEVTEKISVKKAEGADARTVAEVFAQHDALKGKAVAVRGKVVKVNTGIMGRNWIHLRDGSGTPEGKDNDLTVTTNDTAAKGDVVLVKGTVGVDRDFGAGYTYTVIVEDGKVTK